MLFKEKQEIELEALVPSIEETYVLINGELRIQEVENNDRNTDKGNDQ